MAELEADIHEQIKQLSAVGDVLAEAEQYKQALEKYWQAWELLPEPQNVWTAATWLLAAIGDANFLSGDFEAGRENLSHALRCPGALENPFIHLRFGQCLLEMDECDRAANELTSAYMLEGYSIFEEEDPKYFAFLKTQLRPPTAGWEDEQK